MEADVVAKIIASAGGEIIGRIRFQKIVYLLNRMGVSTGARFRYHYYGPYSEDLSKAISDANHIDRLISEECRETIAGLTYSVFSNTSHDVPSDHNATSLDLSPHVEALEQMKTVTSVVLEIAATIRWLIDEEKIEDWRTELLKRKPEKASAENVDRALALLKRIDLPAE